MKRSLLATLALLSSALLLAGEVYFHYYHKISLPYATIHTACSQTCSDTPSLFCNPIAAGPITPRKARQSGDDTDSGCDQTPAGRDGRDGQPGPPGPQGLAGTATEH